MSREIEPFNIKSLFSSDKYIIPIYQRNYSWGEEEITQLIQDIADFAEEKRESDYHIGTLVVYERNVNNSIIYETIDGQQRLTTLSILLSVIKREYSKGLDIKKWYKLNLEFDSRQISKETLEHIFQDEEKGRYIDHKQYNTSIHQAYNVTKKALDRILKKNKLNIQDFYEYLKEKVLLLRVKVPHDTDLNHYFEIMNSRGEQLEKHEILKARFLEIFRGDENKSYAFNKIWESCADMERYVQFGFKVTERDALFTPNNWNKMTCSNFDEISKRLEKNSSSKYVATEMTLKDITDLQTIDHPEEKINEEGSERFSPVINFSNFLLHVLRIQTREDIKLDDKSLLDLFHPFIKVSEENNKISFAEEFGFNLLKCKFLFDKYIIKREFIKDNDQWCLKKIKRNNKKVWYVNAFRSEVDEANENREILMILAMFHVSNPTLVYKHWLNAALQFVFHDPECTASDYKIYLEKLAQSFFVDRYLSSEPLEYYEIIYINNAEPKNQDFVEELLHKGTAVENFVFNYLDWLLWKQKEKELSMEFTFRSSVEHFYPQNPKEGHDKIDDNYLHHFGNLCLISSSKNSALSNYMPTAKREHYKKVKPDSIKQQLMMDEKKYSNWGKEEIEKHGEEMIKIFQDEIAQATRGQK
jgi:hypothetical protein